MMVFRLWIAALLALGVAVPARAQTTGADLVGEWSAKQAIEQRCHIHLGRGSFRIAPASRPGVYRLSGRLTYRSAVRPECQGTARASKRPAHNTASNCQVVSNRLVCKSRRGSRSFEIGAKSLVSNQRTPDGASITTILRKSAKKAAAATPPPSRTAAPGKLHSKFRQAGGARPALPESAANTALALRVQKAQNLLDKAAESLFRADLAATSSTTTQANELAGARAYLAEYDVLAATLAVPAAVRNPVLKNTSTVVLKHLGKMNSQVRHYLAVSEALHQAAVENATPAGTSTSRRPAPHG